MILRLLIVLLIISALLFYAFRVVIPEYKKMRAGSKRGDVPGDPGHPGELGDLDSLLDETEHVAVEKKRVTTKINNTKKALDKASKQLEN